MYTFSRFLSFACLLGNAIRLALGWPVLSSLEDERLKVLLTRRNLEELAFILVSCAISAWVWRDAGDRYYRATLSWLARAFAFCGLLIALLQPLFALFPEFLVWEGWVFPGTFSPNATVAQALVCVSVILVTFGVVGRWFKISQVLALFGAAIAACAVIGHLFSAPALYRIGGTDPLGPSTTVSILLLAMASLNAGEEKGLLRAFTGKSTASLLAQRLILPALLVPILLGWMSFQGKMFGIYDHNLMYALVIAAISFLFLGIIWQNALTIYSVDLQRKKAEESLAQSLEELRGALEQAELANRTKTQFLANMSHEIRTPLAAIMGYAELMQGSKANAADQSEHASIIHRSSAQLLRLIDDILDLSKVEADRLDLEKKRFSVSELLQDVRWLLAPKAEKKKLEVRVRFSTPVPSHVVSDSTRIRQILVNIMGNAIKFTEQGFVELVLTHRHGPQAGAQAGTQADVQGAKEKESEALRIWVTDTGIGIPPANHGKIFEPFVQADSSTTRRFGGTGLGLALSRRLARALGGELSLVESNPGRGTTFQLDLPITSDPRSKMLTELQDPAVGLTRVSTSEAVDETPLLLGKRILLVEDSIDNQIVLGKFLSMAGAQVDLASHGAEAIEKATRQEFDLILMDVQMPVLDGYEATRQLRSQGFMKPIVALTAHALKEERARCLAAGCSGHLTKPISKKQLEESVYEYLLLCVPNADLKLKPSSAPTIAAEGPRSP